MYELTELRAYEYQYERLKKCHNEMGISDKKTLFLDVYIIHNVVFWFTDYLYFIFL